MYFLRCLLACRLLCNDIKLNTYYIVIQGSKGIRQWQINSCTSPMIKHKIAFLFFRLKLVVETLEH